MGRIKAKTMIEKLGFVDPDRKNPDHTKIHEWTYRNADKIISELFAKGNYEVVVIRKELEYTIESANFVVGFVDLKVQFHKSTEESYKSLTTFFEVKSAIPDFGELLRQMNFYKKYLGQPTAYNKVAYIIVSPDDKYRDIIEEQGFYFYKYKDSDKLF